MPVDVNSNTIRIRVRNPDEFVQDSFRTIAISEDQGISAVIGKLKSDPNGSTHIQNYMFDREKWTAAEAEAWVDKQKRSSEYERRYVAPEDVEFRLGFTKDAGHTIRGYGAVFNRKTRIHGRFLEQVAPGAFAKSLENASRANNPVPIYSLWQHQWDQPLADTQSGTLRLWEDEKGLAYELMPGSGALITRYAEDLVINIKRGIVRQSSFGFSVEDESQDINAKTREVTRTIKRARLFDVGPVTLGAYPQTEGLSIRAFGDEKRSVYLNGDRVIEITIPEVVPAGPEITTEELFKKIEDMKRKVLG